MADVKWIKITTDIFDDEKILLIESLPDSYAIITVWFKLLCLAGKQNNSGVFMMGRIAYTDKMLATIFRMKESTVTMALKTFEEFGMVEIVDGVITIPNWGKHQNLEQLESRKEYMRNYMKGYREKQKAIAASENSDETELPYATWQDVKRFFDNKCAYCGKSVRHLEQEHVIPFAKGGKLIVENIVPACRKCNASKGISDFEEWYINSEVFSAERYERIKEYLGGDFRKCLHKRLPKPNVNSPDKEEDKELDKESDYKNNILSSSDESDLPAPKSKKDVKHKHGEYNNVLLTDDELDKLKSEFFDWQDRIERLSSYVASSGKKYKSHYATIRNWAKKDKETQPQQQQTRRPTYDLEAIERMDLMKPPKTAADDESIRRRMESLKERIGQ